MVAENSPLTAEIVRKIPATASNPNSTSEIFGVAAIATRTIPDAPSKPSFRVLKAETPNSESQRRQIIEKDKKITEFSKEFFRTIEHDFFEFGVTSNVERLVNSWLSRDLETTQLALSQIFYNNRNSEKISVGILKIIAHVDFETLSPSNRGIAMVGLTSSSVEVRECAVRAYEYWERPDLMIDLASDTPLTPAWLEEYKQTVIAEARI